MPRKTPTKPGFYWAKSSKEYKGWNMIVLIEGDSPFLHYKAWKINNNEICTGSDPNLYIFGSKIREAKINDKSE